MLGKTHIFSGLFIGLILISFLNTSLIESTILVFISIFGSLFPDIDSPKSYLGRKIKIISKLSKHRGFFHSVIPLAIIYFLTKYLIGFNFALAFAVGFISHIALDMITKEGIHFFPLGIHIRGPVKVGGFLEKLFLLTQILFIILFFTRFIVFFH